MHLHTRNVSTALPLLLNRFYNNEPKTPIRHERTRNGNCAVIDEPVLITYTHPRERVLFNSVRDANPWLHLYEALWMLAGRRDVAPLAYYCSRMPEFSDDGKTLNGAYGYRWRHHQLPMCQSCGAKDTDGIDQLKLLIAHLKADPTSRRAILQMWNVEDDLLKVDTSKDVCCNLSVMFQLRESAEAANLSSLPISEEEKVRRWGKIAYALDMTVTNRSNDLLWGMLGTNYVHFSILQEYMAAHLGVEVGRYHHFTNNLHVYVDRPDWNPSALLAGHNGNWINDEAGWQTLKQVPLVEDPATFDQELDMIVDGHGCLCLADRTKYEEPFIRYVARPMFMAYHAYKEKKLGAAMLRAEQIEAEDWRIVAKQWLKRRIYAKPTK